MNNKEIERNNDYKTKEARDLYDYMWSIVDESNRTDIEHSQSELDKAAMILDLIITNDERRK